MLPPRAARETGYTDCRTLLQNIQPTPSLAEYITCSPVAGNGNQLPGSGFGFNVLPSAWMHYNTKISGISRPRVAIPHPDPPPIPCQQHLVLPMLGKDSKKPRTQQTQSENDGSGQVPARKNSSLPWRGDLLVRFSQLVLFSVIFCPGIITHLSI